MSSPARHDTSDNMWPDTQGGNGGKSTRAARASWGIVALRWVLRPSNCTLVCGVVDRIKRPDRGRGGWAAGKEAELAKYKRQDTTECIRGKKESGAQQKQRHPHRVTLPDLNSLSSMPTNARILTQEVPHRLLFVSRWSHATVWAALWSLDFFSHTQSYS